MNFAPYIGTALMLIFSACLIGVTQLSDDAEGPLFAPGKRIDLGLQLFAVLVAFVAGAQL